MRPTPRGSAATSSGWLSINPPGGSAAGAPAGAWRRPAARDRRLPASESGRRPDAGRLRRRGRRERADAEPAVPAGGGDELPAMGAPSTACNTRWSCSRPARRSPARRWPAAGRTRARSSRPFGAHSAAHQGSSSGPKLRRSDLAMVRLRSGAQNAAAGRLLGPDGAVRRVPDDPAPAGLEDAPVGVGPWPESART